MESNAPVWAQVASLVLFAIFIGFFAWSAWSNYKLTRRIENGM